MMKINYWLQIVVFLSVFYQIFSTKQKESPLIDKLKEIKQQQKDFSLKVKLLKETAELYQQYLEYYLKRQFVDDLDRLNAELELAIVNKVMEFSLKLTQNLDDIEKANLFIKKIIKHHELKEKLDLQSKTSPSNKIIPFKWG